MECSKMAFVLLALVALSSAPGLASADAGYYLTGHPLHKAPVPYGKPASYKPLALSVQGVVFCQNCLYVGTGSLTGAQPLKGARVQLACRDRRYKTFLYDTARTDENGYFLLTIPNFDFRRHNPLRTCRVFLLSSFSPSCNRRTNINSGRFGAYLHLEKTYPDQVLYTVGPFAFAPPTRCKATPPTYYTPPSPTPTHYTPPSPPSYNVSPTSSPTYSPPPPMYESPTSSPTYSPPPPTYASPPAYALPPIYQSPPYNSKP